MGNTKFPPSRAVSQIGVQFARSNGSVLFRSVFPASDRWPPHDHRPRPRARVYTPHLRVSAALNFRELAKVLARPDPLTGRRLPAAPAPAPQPEWTTQTRRSIGS